MNTTAPSIKTLLDSGLLEHELPALNYDKPADFEQAKQKALRERAALVRAIIHGKAAVVDNEQFPKTNSWIRSCHHMPEMREIKMAALNELLGCHGVEAIGDFNNYPPVCHFVYLNTGDTYAATIIRYPGGRYIVSSWGDEVERLERKGIKIP